MSEPYAETDEWPTPPLAARPVFDRADNAARLALEVASLKRENAALRAEVERLRKQRDAANSRTLRHWERAKAAEDRLRKVAELADEWERDYPSTRPEVVRALRAVLAAAPPAAPEAAVPQTMLRKYGCICGGEAGPCVCGDDPAPVSSGEAGTGEAGSLRDELQKAAAQDAERPGWTKSRMPSTKPKGGE